MSDAGDLILKTPSGELRDSRPIAYQEIGGRWVVVGAGFQIDGRVTVEPVEERLMAGKARWKS